jgi:SAM-dependent methyltransferase
MTDDDGSSMNDDISRLEAESTWRIGAIARFIEGVWCVNAAESDTLSYPESGNIACAGVEADSFWFQYRNRVIQKLLKQFSGSRALWDIGGGNGCVSQYLQQQGVTTVLVEPGIDGAEEAARRGLASVISGRLEQLALPAASVPAIGAFDVIEHLAEPGELLQEFRRVLQPDGLLFLTVPAFKQLWSQSDEFAAHHRRYTRKSLTASLAECGFREVKSGYFMSLLVLPVYLLRVLPYRRGKRLSEDEMFAQLGCNGRVWVSTLLQKILSLELIFIPALSMPMGTSVFGVYRLDGQK